MSTTEKPPVLLDCRGIQEELGIGRAPAEAIMRHVPKVHLDGVRRVYVFREDVMRYLERKRRSAT